MVLSNYGSIYSNVWKALQLLSTDPSPLVTDVAKKLIARVKQKVTTNLNLPAARHIIIIIIITTVATLSLQCSILH